MKEKKDKEQKKENINMNSDNNKEKESKEESKEKESKKTKGNGDYLKSLVTEGTINQSLIAEELLGEIEFLKKENEDLKKSCDEYLDRIKRTQADYENYRKRTLREQLELIKRANKDLIEKLLPVLDSFENALNMISEKPEENVDEFYKGVRMIYNKLMEILEKEGLKVINPEGEEFDPQICEAAVTEASDEFKDHHIIAVLRKGYMLNDYVIRPAVVKVCVKK
ncbi:MAG: nucleotide exchange factor GrpE [Cyanobacteria bacterium]|nr:nucleotide exchange factor GrpE [Cyanobacteriota bacterium]